MNKILVATSNPAKREEILHGMSDLVGKGLEILTLKDVSTKGEPIESGDTFKKNAQIKARFYGDQTRLPTLSDDGGLMIDALGGAPGVKSRRWPGYEASDEELIEYALEKMNDVPLGKRTAQLVTCVCLYIPPVVIPSGVEESLSHSSSKFFSEQEHIEGSISTEALQIETNGYPFRALFKVAAFDKFYDEMTEEEHKKENHRLKALRRLERTIKSVIMV